MGTGAIAGDCRKGRVERYQKERKGEAAESLGRGVKGQMRRRNMGGLDSPWRFVLIPNQGHRRSCTARLGGEKQQGPPEREY